MHVQCPSPMHLFFVLHIVQILQSCKMPLAYQLNGVETLLDFPLLSDQVPIRKIRAVPLVQYVAPPNVIQVFKLHTIAITDILQ